MFKLMDKKIIAILRFFLLNWPFEHVETNRREQSDQGLFVCFLQDELVQIISWKIPFQKFLHKKTKPFLILRKRSSAANHR